MESKTLNLLEAMQLAQIVSKYFDTESIKGMTGDVFMETLGQKIDVPSLVRLETLLIGDSTGEIDPTIIITNCTEKMIEFGLLEIMDTYTQIGFK